MVARHEQAARKQVGTTWVCFGEVRLGRGRQVGGAKYVETRIYDGADKGKFQVIKGRHLGESLYQHLHYVLMRCFFKANLVIFEVEVRGLYLAEQTLKTGESESFNTCMSLAECMSSYISRNTRVVLMVSARRKKACCFNR